MVGVFAIVEAFLAPLLGFGRTQVVAKWWAGQTPGALRLWGLIGLTIGIMVVVAVTPQRRDERGGRRHAIRRTDVPT